MPGPIALRAVERELTSMARFCARGSLTAADMWEPNMEKAPAVEEEDMVRDVGGGKSEDVGIGGASEVRVKALT
jgi:hypothetical protein